MSYLSIYEEWCNKATKDADVIKFYLEGNGSVVVRPSGTEPKMKVYVSISAKNEAEANDSEKKVVSFMEQLLK